MRSIDVIIPIYNAYEELTLCLNSVYANTDLSKHRLILINDNSSDERIKELLDGQNHRNVIIIHNEENKGFSNNINIGMFSSDENDVLLLNSDTIVTSKWLEKISSCAYSDRAIGTVTPLSNNATLCSVPVFCEENTLPDEISIEKAGQIVEMCSLKKYPRITVAHGFCMYIKREVIQKIGGFDAKTFERGYGEENDFCNRAQQIGYYHAMCDDTYIYHSGTKSFISKEKEAYIKAHDLILRQCYPEQMHANDLHCQTNPNFFVGDNVSIYFDLNNGKKNILYLLQSGFTETSENSVGGTQLHVRDLTYELRNIYNVFVAYRDREHLVLTIYYGKKERTFKYHIGKQEPYYSFNDKNIEELWRSILSAFRIDVVHVHHVLTTSFDIFYAAKEYNIPIIFTAHDYFFVCPTIKLLDEDGKVCACRDDNKCVDCLHAQLGITDRVDYMSVWRERCLEAFEMCEKVIVPDQSVCDILLNYYPTLQNRIQVIPHGYSLPHTNKQSEIECTYEVVQYIEKIQREGNTYSIRGWAYLKNEKIKNNKIYVCIKNSQKQEVSIPCALEARLDVCTGNAEDKVGFFAVIPAWILNGKELEIRIAIEARGVMHYSFEVFKTPSISATHNKNLNIAFIGGLSKEKGGEEIYHIIRKKKSGVNWFVFGSIGVDELTELRQGNLIKTGRYSSDDLQALLKTHRIDVVSILSIWPETYCYTLTEALINRVPVIATDIGALGRRIAESECGWTIPIDNIQRDFLDVLRQISTSSILDEKRSIMDRMSIPSIKQMARSYSSLYSKFFREDISYERADYELIYKGTCDERGSRVGEDIVGVQDIERIISMKNEIDKVRSSFTCKLVYKIWAMPIPSRKLIKRMIKAFVK